MYDFRRRITLTFGVWEAGGHRDNGSTVLPALATPSASPARQPIPAAEDVATRDYRGAVLRGEYVERLEPRARTRQSSHVPFFSPPVNATGAHSRSQGTSSTGAHQHFLPPTYS
jgi:hypothetical protein